MKYCIKEIVILLLLLLCVDDARAQQSRSTDHILFVVSVSEQKRSWRVFSAGETSFTSDEDVRHFLSSFNLNEEGYVIVQFSGILSISDVQEALAFLKDCGLEKVKFRCDDSAIPSAPDLSQPPPL